MITTNTGAKKLEASDNWREIFPNPDLSTAGAHNASVDAADRIQPEIAPIINGKQCSVGAASGDYVLLRNSTITGKSDGAYIAAKAIPANTDIDSTYLGNAITNGISNSLNNNLKHIVKADTYNGTTSGTGTVNIITTKKLLTAYGTGASELIYIPCRDATGAYYFKAMNWDMTVAANKTISITYTYIDV